MPNTHHLRPLELVAHVSVWLCVPIILAALITAYRRRSGARLGDRRLADGGFSGFIIAVLLWPIGIATDAALGGAFENARVATDAAFALAVIVCIGFAFVAAAYSYGLEGSRLAIYSPFLPTRYLDISRYDDYVVKSDGGILSFRFESSSAKSRPYYFVRTGATVVETMMKRMWEVLRKAHDSGKPIEVSVSRGVVKRARLRLQGRELTFTANRRSLVISPANVASMTLVPLPPRAGVMKEARIKLVSGETVTFRANMGAKIQFILGEVSGWQAVRDREFA